MPFKSIKDAISNIESKKISIRELNLEFIKKIKDNKNLNIFIYFDEKKIINQIDNLEKNNSNKKLKGIPLAIKDLFCTKKKCQLQLLQKF